MKYQHIVITVKALCLFGCCYSVVGTVLNVLPALFSCNSHTHFLWFRFSHHPNWYEFPGSAVKKYFKLNSLNNRNVLSHNSRDKS